MVDDVDSPGIQVADLILWLMKRINDSRPLGPACVDLMHYVFRRSMYQELSFEHVGNELLESRSKLFSKNPSKAEMDAGARLLEEERQRRQRQLAEYAEKKLLN